MIYLILPPATLFSLLLSLFLYVNSLERHRKGERAESEPPVPQGGKRNYLSLNCFHYTKYSNSCFFFFFFKRAEIILKKVNAIALCNTSWVLFSHLLARSVLHMLMMHLNSLKGLFIDWQPPYIQSAQDMALLCDHMWHTGLNSIML